MKLSEVKSSYPELKIYKLNKLPIESIVWTSIGAYGDQSIEEILKEKIEDISEVNKAYDDGGYCLWALNKFKTENVREFCYTRNDTNKPIYVFMKYTVSENADGKTMRCSEHFDGDDINTISKKHEKDLYNLHADADNMFPTELPHKETILSSISHFGKALIIDELGVLDSKIVDINVFLSNYINKQTGENADISIRGHNDSGLLSLKNEIDIEKYCKKLDNSDEIKYYIARLKPPYFVKLKLEDGCNTLPNRNRDNIK